MKPRVIVHDIGVIDYQEAWDFQEELFKASVDLKISNRKGTTQQKTLNHLLFCEHPHVYTLGKSGKESHLLLNNEELKDKNAVFYKINRGGDITYHGPGQLVVYPILDLEHFFTDIHKYMRLLEEAVIHTIAAYGLKGDRIDGMTGVWLDVGTPKERKICALGVKASRWVTMHGIGFTVNTDLDYFSNIVPCGIQDRGVTSLCAELDRDVPMKEIELLFKKSFENVFNLFLKT